MSTASTATSTPPAPSAAPIAPEKTPPPGTTKPVPAPPGAQVKIAGSWPRFETWPRLHNFVQTTIGRLALLMVFTGFMVATHVKFWWGVSIILALLTFFPRQRRAVLIVAALAWAIVQIPLITDPIILDPLAAVLVTHHVDGFIASLPPKAATAMFLLWPLVAALIAWGIGFAYISLVRRYPKSPLGRRPVTGLMVLLTVLMAVQYPLTGTTWLVMATFAMAMSHYIWFFAYSIIEPKQKDGTAAQLRPEYWRYFWATNRCPIGKGPSYLDRIEAKNDAELATVQLKGLKLLMWAFALSFIKIIYTKALYGPASESQSFGFWKPTALIPTYMMTLDAHVAGHPYAWGYRWAAISSHFLLNVLELSIWGHKLIAVARMAGFNAFRMTYKPLLATSIAEFFNRIHWYLKEMLGTFFFYPTYLRYFKKHPRLRVFTATMAAAGLGNFFYHLFAYDRHVYQKGLWGAIVSYHSYAIYALILGIAIGISQIRILGKKKSPPTGFRKVRAIAGVLLFYCLLTIFDAEIRRDLHFGHYFTYFLSLFIP